MKKNKFLKVFSSAVALSVVLAGCSSSSNNSSSTKGAKPKVEFKTSVDNGGNLKEGQTLKYGILSSTPLTGLWNVVFSDQATDQFVHQNVMGGTFPTDAEGRAKLDKEDAPVKMHLDREKNEVTLTIHKDLKWNNGENVTSKDIVATYELMGNPKFTTNVRYNDSFEFIEGMKEYHEGKANTISGIKVKDDNTVVIKYSQLRPSIQWGEGMVTDFLNAKQVEAASKDFTKFAEAELNKKPLSYGPYYLDKVVNGESVLAKANPYYYKKSEVKIPEIQFKVVSPAQASAVLKNGDVDLMDSLTTGIWDGTKDAKNGTILGESDYYVSYVGFKLGKFNKEKGEVEVDPNAKAADKRVRQAFGYAVDWDQINEKIYKGLRFTPTGSGFYPPIVKMFYNKDGEKYTKDVEKAKKLLDEAGLKDTDGDGLREDKNGKKLTFNFAIRNVGQDFDQTLADTFVKSWKEVGLDVKLVDGKLMSSKDWSQRVQADDPGIDIFQGAWGLGSDPNVASLVGKTSPLNLQRYTTEELQKSLDAMGSSDMFDDAKLKEAYQKFDKQFREEAAWLPFSWQQSMTWVNKRVKTFDLAKLKTGEQRIYKLELTADAPAKN